MKEEIDGVNKFTNQFSALADKLTEDIHALDCDRKLDMELSVLQDAEARIKLVTAFRLLNQAAVREEDAAHTPRLNLDDGEPQGYWFSCHCGWNADGTIVGNEERDWSEHIRTLGTPAERGALAAHDRELVERHKDHLTSMEGWLPPEDLVAHDTKLLAPIRALAQSFPHGMHVVWENGKLVNNNRNCHRCKLESALTGESNG